MPGDGESVKQKKGHGLTKGPKYDYAKEHKEHDESKQAIDSRDLPNLQNAHQESMSAPKTKEEALREVWKTALEKNKTVDHPLSAYEVRQKQIVDTLYQIEAGSSAPLDGQKAVARLQQIKDHLEPMFSTPLDGKKIVAELQQMRASDQPPNIREIVGDLQVIIAMNLIGMKEMVNNAKKNGSVDKSDAIKIHSRIFGSIGACGGYYLYIRNNIPPFEQSKRAAGLLLAPPIGEFQKALGEFQKALDTAFPWEYKHSAGLAFGIEPPSPSNFDQETTVLSPDDQKRLDDSYKAVSKAGKALNKRLEYIISLGTSVEKWQEAVELKEKRRRQAMKPKL